MRGRLDNKGGPGHPLGCLPGAVLLFLLEGSVLPASVLLPSLGGGGQGPSGGTVLAGLCIGGH